ncbi:MAG: DUF1697 domain-containing protein [Saprospiraceae bacterium]|nr:DUF1697 domain-containing protein [Saprospiraceae bacterium]
MTTYIALLRGINVSGHNPIKMETLKTLFESLGFSQVRTYIQSGNVVFESAEKDASALKAAIEAQIKQQFDFEVAVMLRTATEWHQIMSKNPFQSAADADGTKVHIVFFSQAPDAALVEQLSALPFDNDEFTVIDREMYLHCPNGYGRDKAVESFY